MEKIDRIKGCMFGLAVGDAVGYPVEFHRVSNISRRKTLAIGGNKETMLYSDDTQMSIATAEAILSVSKDGIRGYDEEGVLQLVMWEQFFHSEYMKWYATQKDPSQSRAPGNSCLSALAKSKRGPYGTINKPINDSKGCGGVMRTAPIGLVFDGSRAFELGARAAAITHGHKTGYLTAGFLSELISRLLTGESFNSALGHVMTRLKGFSGYKETYYCIARAVELATRKGEDSPAEDARNIEKIGEGWIAEEALAIAIYCVIKHPTSFENAIAAAVCHSGDSDSTGSIAGAILGTILGYDAIPERWRDNIENKVRLLGLSDQLMEIGGRVDD